MNKNSRQVPPADATVLPGKQFKSSFNRSTTDIIDLKVRGRPYFSTISTGQNFAPKPFFSHVRKIDLDAARM